MAELVIRSPIMYKLTPTVPETASPLLGEPAPVCRSEVQINTDLNQILTLASPPAREILALVTQVEEQFVASFWRDILCGDSPYDPRLPFGLAASTNGLTLVRSSVIMEQLKKQFPRHHFSATARRTFATFTLEQLKAALGRLTPVSITSAKQMLQSNGIQRLNAVSPSEGLAEAIDIAAAVRHLSAAAMRRDGAAAATALVAMRSSRWILLPRALRERVAVFGGTLDKVGAIWNSPYRQLSSSLLKLAQGLMPVELRPFAAKIADRLVRTAVLGTSLTNESEFTWDLATEILSTEDYPARLREHWRSICRTHDRQHKGGPEASRRSPPPDSGKTIPSHHARWQMPSTCSTSCDVDAEEVQVGDSRNDSVVVNHDEKEIILLEPIEKEDVSSVVIAVERTYVEHFRRSMVLPSPYDPRLPLGLAASAQGHSLLPPIDVYASITGHRDLNSREALAQLKQIPVAELEAAITRMVPTSVAMAQSVLTVNGVNRLRAISLQDKVMNSDSLRNFITVLAKYATGPAPDKGKAIAQAALIAMRSRKWIVLPEIVCRHIGSVLRGLASDEMNWVLNPMEMLSGFPLELYRALRGESVKRNDLGKDSELIVRIAVLCTSVNTFSQITMPLRDAILSKRSSQHFNGLAALRARWQKLCERNGDAAFDPVENPNQDHKAELRKRFEYSHRVDQWMDLISVHCGNH